MVRIRNSELDWCGVPLSHADPSSLGAWNAAQVEMLHFRGDPLGRLAAAIDGDPLFGLGRVFRLAVCVLGGWPLDDPTIVGDRAALAASRGDFGEREQGHVDAADAMADGDFDRAAVCWERVVDRWPRDLAAIRFAHDVYLHIGDDRSRLTSSERALGSFEPGEVAHGYVLGQLAFAKEEVGEYDAALEAAMEALEINPDDMWALHAAAHVHEMRDDSVASHELLDPAGNWRHHDLLASHLWWHRGIRLVADGRVDEAFAIADELMADPAAPFTLSDLTSLLVRLECRGHDVGHRWERVIDTWRNVATRHTCGFLDLHAALAGLADPEFGREWQGTQHTMHRPPHSWNDRLFHDVVEPLTDAVLDLGRGDRGAAIDRLRALSDRVTAIGGSLAQRQVIDIAAGATVIPRAAISADPAISPHPPALDSRP